MPAAAPDLPLGKGVRVIRQDASGLMALDKPAALLSHPNEPGDEARSLLRAAYDHRRECYAWPGGQLFLLNRLDSATSGVILAATNEDLARTVREQFETREIEKSYLALVFGVPRTTRQSWTDRLEVRQLGGSIRTSGSGHMESRTDMRLIKTIPGAVTVSLIELRPRTGRSHQLRVQCQRRHLPIVGDATYGDFAKNRAFARASGTKRLFLHSRRTELEFTFQGRQLGFAAECEPGEDWPAAYRAGKA
jgi:23S rRNA-/tRNA-specific pseudouridylate synthase